MVQKWGPKQRIDVHTLSPSMKCDHKILVIQFHGVLVYDLMLTSEYEKNLVRIPESLLNQKVKWNYQLEVQDHFQAQVQFRERITCQNVKVVFKILGKFKWM